MKKRLLLIIVVLFAITILPLSGQSKFIRKVANSVEDEILGQNSSPKKSNTQPEPSCACNSPEMIFDLGGKLNLAYSEISIDVLDDGSMLVMDRISQKYYIIKDGSTKGPLAEDDPQVEILRKMAAKEFENTDDLVNAYKDYISRNGDKYTISFAGKSYGPYAQIENFMVTKSKDKFAAVVVENIAITNDQGKKMEEAMKNAKTDQEKMDLAMQFAQQMQQNMMAGGGPQSTTPKLVSNIEGATYNPFAGGTFSADMKYDDILVKEYTGNVSDLKGNKVISIKPEYAGMNSVFINSANTKYVAYDYGTAYFSDGTTMTDLFNPRLIKAEGKTFLAYMYYSPAKNAIMQCRIAF